MTTRRPRALSRLPRLEPVRPLPREEATPPVTKMCLACRLAPVRAEDKSCSRGVRLAAESAIHGSPAEHQVNDGAEGAPMGHADHTRRRGGTRPKKCRATTTPGYPAW